MTDLFDLSGRVAVITGSAQGMGRAMAIALAEAGADLVLLDRNAPGIEATARIDCLNASPQGIDVIEAVVKRELSGWI